MADLYGVRVAAVTPQKGRTRPIVSLHVIQLREEGGLRGMHVETWKTFAGRILWDSGIAAFQQGIPEPWARGTRFPYVMKAILRDVVQHDLVRLVDHDRDGLRRLIELTGNDELDPDVYREVHGDDAWPIRGEPANPANYLDEGRLDVSLAIDPPAELTVGLAWKSAAFTD